MQLDLTSMRNALGSLERAIVRAEGAPQDTELRDSVIQRFECTYELCVKMIKRRLEQDVPTPATVDAMDFRDLIRDAAERGLVATPTAWFEYREQRNITAHTYDEKKAAHVYRTALRFQSDARALLVALEARNR